MSTATNSDTSVITSHLESLEIPCDGILEYRQCGNPAGFSAQCRGCGNALILCQACLNEVRAAIDNHPNSIYVCAECEASGDVFDDVFEVLPL